MTESIVVVGAGGFGRETLDVIAAVNKSGVPSWDVVGVVDNQPSDVNLQRLNERGTTYLGTESQWFSSHRAEKARFVVGIGSPRIRSEVSQRWHEQGLQAATLIHPAAMIGECSVVGEGSVICGGVQISTNVRIGRHVHVNPNATIGHDAALLSHTSVNPGAIVSGDVVVHERVLIGAGAVILQGLTVGASSTVGAAACVVRDVAEQATVKGVPAR